MQKSSPLIEEVTLFIHTLHVTKQKYDNLQRFKKGQAVTNSELRLEFWNQDNSLTVTYYLPSGAL